MAVSQSAVSYSTANFRCEVQDVTFDSSYPTGGEAVTLNHISAPVFGIATIKSSTTTDGDTVAVYYNASTGKILAYTSGGGQVSNTTDLSGLVVQLVVWGQ